jgi:hypothetical protein
MASDSNSNNSTPLGGHQSPPSSVGRETKQDKSDKNTKTSGNTTK